MSQKITKRLDLLSQSSYLPLLAQCLHGIERECLRVTSTGGLAHTPHPRRLGSALTHPSITTDYAEALMEFVTQATPDTDTTLNQLEAIHQFVTDTLDEEFLWSASMPCALPPEDQIQIAYFGTSNAGQVRHIYRRGLAVRYGKTMQCIAGIHYNFSLPEALWPMLQAAEQNQQSLLDFQSSQYIEIIRNFRRYSWLLMYLFGASPALDASFVKQYPNHGLQVWDANTYYLPYATSLRMGDLGYTSKAQEGLTPCYNNLATYIDSVTKAISTPYPPYERIGTKKDGQWIQLNSNIIQIENEYYSNIRPKRVVKEGERPIYALRKRGIQYIEVRCMDVNPFLPLGIDQSTSYFLNSFLVYCLVKESPLLVDGECRCCSDNFATVVKEGRKPGLTLLRNGKQVLLQDWANDLLDAIAEIAELLDRAQQTTLHTQAVMLQREKLTNTELLPSAKVLATMKEKGMSFAEFALAQSKQHAQYFKQSALTPETKQQFETLATQSLQQQSLLEADTAQDLDSYIAEYLANKM